MKIDENALFWFSSHFWMPDSPRSDIFRLKLISFERLYCIIISTATENPIEYVFLNT